MSQPRRYSLVASYYCSDAKMKAFEDGEFVRHADYAALKAENEKYRRVFQGEAGWTLVEPNHLAALQAEVERLRKAGDTMDAYLKRLDGTTNGMLECRREWLAAKGVQP